MLAIHLFWSAGALIFRDVAPQNFKYLISILVCSFLYLLGIYICNWYVWSFQCLKIIYNAFSLIVKCLIWITVQVVTEMEPHTLNLLYFNHLQLQGIGTIAGVILPALYTKCTFLEEVGAYTLDDWSEELISDPDNLLKWCDDMDVTKTLDDEKSVGSTNLPKDAGNVLERCDNMDVTKTFDDEKSVGSTNLPKDAGSVLERCGNMDVTKTFDDEKSVGSTNLPKDAGSVLERCGNMDVTKTFDDEKSVGSTNSLFF